MTEPLKILLLEDNATDAEIVRRLLKKENLHFEFRLAMNKDAYLQALDHFKPDIILADYSLPQFNAEEALEIVQRRSLSIPFILVTGTTSEEFAAHIIKLGADDFILKDRLARLPAAINAALKQKKTEKKRLETQQKLIKSELSLKEAQRIAQIGSWELNLVTNLLLWSDEVYRIFEIDPEKFDATYEAFLNVIHPDDREMVNKAFTDSVKNNTAYSIDHRLLFPDGRIKFVHEQGETFYNEEGIPVRSLGTVQDITEKKLAEEKVRESELRYRSLVEHASDGILVADLQGNIIEVNSAICSMFGYTKEEVLQKNVSLFLEPNDLQLKPMRFDLLQKGQSILVERRAIHKNGNLYDIEISSKLTGEGKVLSIIRDISERKKAEASLFKSQQRYKNLLDNMNDGLIVYDVSGNVVFTNKKFLEVYGFAEDDINNIKLEDYVAPEYREVLHDRHNRRISGEKVPDVFEYEGLRKDGQRIWLGVRVNLVVENGIITGTQSIIRDITESKKAENKIRESNERYEFVNKATQDTIWEWDYAAKEGRWGEGIMKTFGYTNDKLIYGEDWIEDYVYPYDKEEVRRSLRTCIESGIENWQSQYRFRCADGAYKYVYDRGFILYDKKGNPARMIGAMTDVTEKKRLERELAEQQIRQQKLITETTIQTQEEERNQLGRELHDNINQILATVKMYLGMAKEKENIPKDLVGQSYEYVNEAMEEIRKLSHSLVAPSLGDIGLKEALQELVDDANLLNDIQVRLLIDEKYNEKSIDKNKELMFYRIVQEQLNNIIKYARANKVEIALQADNDNLILSVADNGVGFDTTKKNKGIGLKNISSRVEFYNGTVNIISAPGQGCTLEIFTPC